MELENKRVSVYDWIRLIATILVVIGHSDYLSIGTTYGGVDYALPVDVSPVYYSSFFEFWRWFTDWIYGFHMPLFFMLSGAVFALRPMPLFDKLVKSKVKRLLIPYYLYGLLFMFPVKRLGNFYSNESVVVAMKGFLSGEDSGHLWFLLALFWCFVVFTIIQKVLYRLNVNSLWLTLIICELIDLTCEYIPVDFIHLKEGLGYLLFFAIGYVFEKERKRIGEWSMQTSIVVLLAVTFIEILNKRIDFLDSFFVIMCGSVFILAISTIMDKLLPNTSNWKWWNKLVKSSFYIYLFHDPINYLFLKLFFEKTWLTTGIGCVMFLMCRTIGIFIISLLLGGLVSIVKKYWLSFMKRDGKNSAV